MTLFMVEKENDHLIGGPNADIYICGPGFDTIIGFNNFERDIKTSDCEVIKEGSKYNDRFHLLSVNIIDFIIKNFIIDNNHMKKNL